MSDRVDLAVAIVYPLMKEYFKEWDPLKDCATAPRSSPGGRPSKRTTSSYPTAGRTSRQTPSQADMGSLDAFVRNIVTQWQPRNCDPMVDSWIVGCTLFLCGS